jgi:hypothetical protein
MQLNIQFFMDLTNTFSWNIYKNKHTVMNPHKGERINDETMKRNRSAGYGNENTKYEVNFRWIYLLIFLQYVF